ncbi:MAG: AbrB/MazE/SpoVT family DNA-binding domain-containing protein [Lysobacterales bacterium CG02_land_8_20_14_3_00_62_12]|jgi:AbrB family looped-hinge helix DNA binding protein|nr:MAG: AbrB/MazE/SpoVT family DNA-binding domain-containing protein [Xanthomonadales bacterium CG02_land_8_20_14_3_00_62_12]
MNPTTKLTAQAQVSVPAAVRRQLGLGVGSVLSWEADDDRVIVRRVGQHSSVAIHNKIFPKPPKRKSADAIKAGVRAYMIKRHARG